MPCLFDIRKRKHTTEDISLADNIYVLMDIAFDYGTAVEADKRDHIHERYG